MTNEKRLLYKKAYVELNEIFKLLSEKEKEKIPEIVFKNIAERMDKNYIFKIDTTKNLENQNFMIETQALLVEIYRKYLVEEHEVDLWKKYDLICSEEIEKNKKIKYNEIKNKDMFKKKSEISKLPIIQEQKKVTFFKKILDKIKEKILHIKKK